MEFTRSKEGIFIVADDLGLSPGINEGIVYLLKNSFISGASLMANGMAFDDAVRRCSEIGFLNIGVHLVLVEEKPLVLKTFPKDHRVFFFKYILGLIRKNDIEKELEAQINKCLKAQINLRFINSHQHLHLLPGIMDIIISLAKKYEIPYIRIVNEPLNTAGGPLRKAQLVFLNFLSGIAKKMIIRSGLRCNDFFVGFINAGNLSEKDIESVKELSDKYPDRIIELGCHPGFENEELKMQYNNWGNYNWRKELRLLSSWHD
ncbi:MAG: ChbG/HpnK family deacetylase [Candidatus Yanofskybacteria bacterium]|nr:ChbG/HpnK family deacetylase [Candidatus Yanofskybacteria bacterium]